MDELESAVREAADKVSEFTPSALAPWKELLSHRAGERDAPLRGRRERKQDIDRFDERSLRWIAETTGGSAHRSFTGQELEGFFEGIVRRERKIEGFKKVVLE